MLEQFKKDKLGFYIYADNYQKIKMSLMPYEKVKDLIDKKKRSRKR